MIKSIYGEKSFCSIGGAPVAATTFKYSVILNIVLCATSIACS